jgi:hypothetical protein
MTEEIIDYALPCMRAEQGLKDAHNAFLDQDLDRALTCTMEAIINARLMYAALRHAKENKNTTYRKPDHV